METRTLKLEPREICHFKNLLYQKICAINRALEDAICNGLSVTACKLRLSKS
jgi:hypothetical protein